MGHDTGGGNDRRYSHRSTAGKRESSAGGGTTFRRQLVSVWKIGRGDVTGSRLIYPRHIATTAFGNVAVVRPGPSSNNGQLHGIRALGHGGEMYALDIGM